jgi:hypothetical protein
LALPIRDASLGCRSSAAGAVGSHTGSGSSAREHGASTAAACHRRAGQWQPAVQYYLQGEPTSRTKSWRAAPCLYGAGAQNCSHPSAVTPGEQCGVPGCFCFERPAAHPYPLSDSGAAGLLYNVNISRVRNPNRSRNAQTESREQQGLRTESGQKDYRSGRRGPEGQNRENFIKRPKTQNRGLKM